MNDVLRADIRGGATSFGQRDWREVIRATPPERVGYAVTMAVSGSAPRDPQPPRPMNWLTPQQQSDVIQMVLSELEKEGLDRQEISQRAFVCPLDPYRMSPQEMTALLRWTQQQRPQVLARVAACYYEQPEVLSSLLGESTLMKVVSSLTSSSAQRGPCSTC